LFISNSLIRYVRASQLAEAAKTCLLVKPLAIKVECQAVQPLAECLCRGKSVKGGREDIFFFLFFQNPKSFGGKTRQSAIFANAFEKRLSPSFICAS
jgi:hypothetical protein